VGHGRVFRSRATWHTLSSLVRYAGGAVSQPRTACSAIGRKVPSAEGRRRRFRGEVVNRPERNGTEGTG